MTTTQGGITVFASSRHAGRNTVHTVARSDGGVVHQSTRRSASNRYDFAICRWHTVNGQSSLVVKRWSNSSRASGRDFAVRVEHA